VVRRGIANQAPKNLRLAGQAAKGARVQDARGIAGKGRAVGVQRLGVRTMGQFAVRANSNPSWQRVARIGFRNLHRRKTLGSLLFIS